MSSSQAFNQEQRERWNGDYGDYWTTQQERMDRTLAAVMPPLMAFAAPRQGSKTIDIGCGCGATTIELAKAVGPSGHVTGIDISEQMLARAKERLAEFGNATVLLGDAGSLPLAGTNAELVMSRFGVMFFGDPVAAFTNIRTSLAPGGRLRFVCWRPIDENPFMHVPLNAVFEHVPRPPKPDPEEPGPFSFANTERVTRILTAAGFTPPRFEAVDIQMSFGATLDDAVAQASETGPASRALIDQSEDVRAAALESIRKALRPYALADGVKLRGATWLVAAE
jgi:SAM-dependent methyltransferase